MKALEELAFELLAQWYREHPGVNNLAQALEDISDPMLTEIVNHPELLEPGPIIEHALRAADRLITEEGKKVFTRMRKGESPLPLSEFYEAVIPLGVGERCKIGDMRMAEYIQADKLRYDNVRRSQESYNAWRDWWTPLLPSLERGISVRDIPDSQAA